jgi:hypothetical protein
MHLFKTITRTISFDAVNRITTTTTTNDSNEATDKTTTTTAAYNSKDSPVVKEFGNFLSTPNNQQNITNDILGNFEGQFKEKNCKSSLRGKVLLKMITIS